MGTFNMFYFWLILTSFFMPVTGQSLIGAGVRSTKKAFEANTEIINKMRTMELKMGKFRELERKVSRIPELERKVARMPELERKVARMPELERNLTRISELERKVVRIPELERQVGQMQGMNNRITTLENEISVLKYNVTAGNRKYANLITRVITWSWFY